MIEQITTQFDDTKTFREKLHQSQLYMFPIPKISQSEQLTYL